MSDSGMCWCQECGRKTLAWRSEPNGRLVYQCAECGDTFTIIRQPGGKCNVQYGSPNCEPREEE
jgi:DNA-directed RNA polymerase subunit RPC12/RpoP